MFFLLIIFWFLVEIKFILFWLYLWQLKDYHIGRFVAHFETYKAKKIFLNFIQLLKIFLFILLLISASLVSYLFWILFAIYVAESVLFLRGILFKSAKVPQATPKMLILMGASFSIVVLFLYQAYKLGGSLQLAWLLGFNILIPLIVSVVVLFFQPFFVLARNNILKKAAKKITEIRASSNLVVIAISGSYGKTTTKEFLATILSKKYKVLATNKHQNSEMGVANCILNNLEPSHQIFIAEVGAYNKGKVKEVCSMLKPKIGIVTGVNEQHLALFGSMENLLSAEGGGELAEALPKDGLIILNGDNKYCIDLYRKLSKPKKIYTIDNKSIDSDIRPDSITVQKDNISFVVVNKNKEMAYFSVNVLGRQNVLNLSAAILAANDLGMTLEEISEACKDIKQEQAGMTLKLGKHGINIIDSSYSANPDGVIADLNYLSIFSAKKIIVMPCLIELGKKSSEIHEKIGKKIGEICDLAIITSKDKFVEIKKGAIEAGMAEKNIVFCDKLQDIYSLITLFCKSEDAVLLEGRVPAGLIELLVS
jgi:UDP-N-acetylmuramoyl-tripeptide--D-alanyl-D-alanine ligase